MLAEKGEAHAAGLKLDGDVRGIRALIEDGEGEPFVALVEFMTGSGEGGVQVSGARIAGQRTCGAHRIDAMTNALRRWLCTICVYSDGASLCVWRESSGVLWF